MPQINTKEVIPGTMPTPEGIVSDSPYLPDGRQWAWDSSTIEPAKACARKYQYMREGWRPKSESVHLTFGAIYAKALEVFHKLRAEGVEYNDAQRKVVKLALELSYGKLDPAACAELSGGARYKSRPNLIRSIIWYLEHYRYDPCHTIILDNGNAAVELSFKFQVHDDIWLTGHLDRVVEFQGDHYIQDQKTTGSAIAPYYFKRYSPNTQMSCYSIASKIVWKSPVKGVMIDAAQISQGFTRFDRGFAFRTQEQCDEWLKDTIALIQKIWQHDIDGYYPQNDAACMMYGGCPFLDVCSKSPQIRRHYLESNYEKNVWNPLENR